MSDEDTRVVDNPGESRFEVRVGDELAGFAAYEARDGRVVFTHTEVDDAFQGRGLAGVLVKAALDSVRERGLRATPECPYVARYIEKHPAYADLVES